jgi:integrase
VFVVSIGRQAAHGAVSHLTRSFRHTYAQRALENGRQITWLSKHLGHSSLKITSDVYGHWETAEKKAQAEQMAGVFGL